MTIRDIVVAFGFDVDRNSEREAQGSIKGIANLAKSVLGAIGIANMWIAIFADVGVMVIAVLNAIRALNVKHL